ncbi:MAG TPA: Hint domain-containing protein [Candidatus Omnitrophota bacterium]|nr:Hint domain-containing protein [Candidatus Omnitrophota bacterium]HPD84166.1 Hint domain-containing protein [Candidatus Omnitrophota bacterium]HRZ03023.1 Hint domain-containing protein [Candidatus Omnitrophota bacterium]
MKDRNYIIKGSLGILLLLFSAAAGSPAQASLINPVMVQGRQLLVDFDGNDIYEPYMIRGVAYNPYPVGVFPTEWGTCEYCAGGVPSGCFYSSAGDGGYACSVEHPPTDPGQNGGPVHPWGGQSCGGVLPFPNLCVNLFDRGDVNLDRDFQKLVTMNVNTIRTWEKVTPTLLAKANQYGIKVIAGYWIGEVTDFSDPGTQVGALKNDFRNYIQHMVADPNFSAVLFVAIGNENNYHYYLPGDPRPPEAPYCYFSPSDGPETGNLYSWYFLVNQLAGVAKGVIGMNRPVAAVNGDIVEIGQAIYYADDSHMANLDIWGVNVYRGISFGNLFTNFASHSQKPLWISECGVDAVSMNDFYDAPPDPPYDPQDGQEAPETQARWNAVQWREIVMNRTIAIGATYMEYSDEWWKGVVQDQYHWDSFTREHNYSGICHQYEPSVGVLPDSYFNEEWWGLMEASTDQGPGVDTLVERDAYYALRDNFTCDSEPNVFYTGPYNSRSCDGTYACCPTASKMAKNGQCVASCGGCFLAGTPISMADGSFRPIESIKIGDMVLAYDETSGQIKPDEVTNVFNHPKEDNYLIINGQLKVTPIHSVLSKGEWRPIGELKVGDTLTDPAGKDISIVSIVPVQEKIDIFNFETSPHHTYIAGGYVVHNRKMDIHFAVFPEGGER